MVFEVNSEFLIITEPSNPSRSRTLPKYFMPLLGLTAKGDVSKGTLWSYPMFVKMVELISIEKQV
jgi:hypothetical protein